MSSPTSSPVFRVSSSFLIMSLIRSSPVFAMTRSNGLTGMLLLVRDSHNAGSSQPLTGSFLALYADSFSQCMRMCLLETRSCLYSHVSARLTGF